MGNDNQDYKRSYEMNVTLIGGNLENFKNRISRAKSKYSIQNFWKFYYEKDKTVEEQINSYFNKLQQIRNGEDQTINLKECLLVKLENIFDPELNLIQDKVNRLGEVQYMPLVLFLLKNNYSNDIDFKIDEVKYKRLDHRLFLLAKLDEYNEDCNKNVDEILLRFCSIHNELGDDFIIGKGDQAENYNLIYNYFPFNINIACIGRFGQGKSTGVNVLLNEYKAKESSKGSSQTKQLTYYQVSNQPIRVLDIPGFEDTETVKAAVEKFKQCGDKINKIKDNLHIILYFMNYHENRTFQTLELPILEELCNHPKSKVIYVITHSDPDMDEIDKEDKIRNINVGLQNLTKEKDTTIINSVKKGGMLEATVKNVVFVNFHRDNKTKFEKFGISKLFRTIYDYFILSEDYINSNKFLGKEQIEANAQRLRAQAEQILKAHKIGGAVVGIIPGIDWLLQKFVIKKDAAKKVGQIYGIDVSFVDDKGKKISNLNKYKPEFITASVDTSTLQMEMNGEELINESTTYKVGNTFKVAGEAAGYISGGVTIGSGLLKASTIAVEGSSTAATVSVGIGSTALRAVGTGLVVVGAIVGVALGGYFTTKHCNELIDKFEKYYIDNAEKIGNSYKQAAEYLLSQ